MIASILRSKRGANMGRFFLPLRFCLLSICLAALCEVASADAIVEVSSGDLPYGPYLTNSQAVQIYWTQSQGFDDVTISIPLLSLSDNEPLGISYFFTYTSGPGASPTLIAAGGFEALSSTGYHDFVLLSGLDLGSGTYYPKNGSHSAKRAQVSSNFLGRRGMIFATI